MSVQKLTAPLVQAVATAMSAKAMTKSSATPADGAKDIAELIAYGICAGLSSPALAAAIAPVAVTPGGGPVGAMLSAAIQGAAVAVPPV